MSSINPGFSPIPIASSVAGISSSGKNSSTEKAGKADGSAAKVVEKANAETGGIEGSEKSRDRDADGRQRHEDAEESSASAQGSTQENRTPPRSKDPQKLRGNVLDFDA